MAHHRKTEGKGNLMIGALTTVALILGGLTLVGAFMYAALETEARRG